MNSILPIYTVFVLAACTGLVYRSRRRFSSSEAVGIYGLLVALLAWTVVLIALGLKEQRVRLMDTVPFLWQPFVTMGFWITAITLSGSFRSGLRKVAEHTPSSWFVLLQALRIGALGGIIKGVTAQITSGYVLWIGIPDFLFGVSAFVVLWLLNRGAIGRKALIAWNLIGFVLIVAPTFVPMMYWMREPGFRFIFEFPMVLAPGVVVSLLVSLNLLHAWILWKPSPSNDEAR